MRYQRHYVSAFSQIPQIREQLRHIATSSAVLIEGGQPLAYATSEEGYQALAVRRKAPQCQFIGIDLHSDNVYVAIGRFVLDPYSKQRELRIDPARRISITDGGAELLSQLAPYCQGKPHIATVESTFNWGFLADLFAARGWTLLLCDPSTVSRNAIKASNDATDAAFLCRQLAFEQLKTYLPMPAKARAIRDLVRHRSWLVQERASAHVHFVNMMYNQLSLKVDRKDVQELVAKVQAEGWRCLCPLLAEEANALKAAQYLEIYARYNELIEEAEDEIKRLFMVIPYAKELEKIPGIGLVLSTTIGAEIWDLARFRDADRFVSYARLAATSKLSNGKSKGVGNAKNGNAYLSWAFTEVANLMMRCDAYAQGFYDQRLNKYHGLRVKAIRVMAAKIARGIFVSLSKQERFDSQSCFHSKAIKPQRRTTVVKEPVAA